MTPFTALIERLEAARDEETAARALADYLRRAEDPDRGIALGLLLGAIPVARAGRPVVTALAERLDATLLEISLEVVGELAETVALMWPGTGATRPPRLADVVAALAPPAPARDAFVARLAALLDALEPAARVALLRLAGGKLAGLLTPRMAQAALARLGGVAVGEVEAVWHAIAPPYAVLFAWLDGGAPRPSPSPVAPFRPLAPVTPLERSVLARLDPAAFAVEHAWDGLRVLAVSERGERRLYTRRGVDVGARFPEILDAHSIEGALEGVIVARDAEGRVARAALDKRLGSGRVRAGDGPVQLILHDAHALAGEALGGLALRTRRARLEALAGALPSVRIVVGALEELADWAALDGLRAAARAAGAAGVVLKPWDARYREAGWLEARCDPLTARLVLLYLERGLEAPTATLGAWRGESLVPVAKAALPDPGTAAAIADYVAERRVDRFGPVEQVRADADQGLVVEAAFDALEAAPRRKARLVLRGARVTAVRGELAPRAAARVEELAALR
jgi:DNA ligase-1